MPDLTTKLLPRLQNHTLPGLDLGEDIIYPKYEDQSIFNIPSSICHWLDIPSIGEGLLTPEILLPLGKGVRRIVLILIDALSFHRLQRWMDVAPVWRSILKDGLLAPITSITPSTTSSALTTLWTGRSPSAHGITGYEMWLKEYGVVANMILHAPMTFQGDVGSLERAGFSPETFLTLPTFGSHLWNHGVKSYAFQHYSISNSGLSNMFMRDVEIKPFTTPADLWVSMRHLLESQPDKRMYVWSYWGAIDGLSHRYGPDNEHSVAEFAHFSAAFEGFFLNKLSPQARKNTLVILTADHGQIHTSLTPLQVMKNHPALNQHLHINPTGENRMSNLYLRPTREEAVRDYFETAWPGKFALITPNEALQAGLFGPSPHHPDLRNRIGDLIAIAHEDAYLWWADKEDFLLGRHGGMHPEEMLVPFLGARL